jgi:hypothetical protein
MEPEPKQIFLATQHWLSWKYEKNIRKKWYLTKVDRFFFEMFDIAPVLRIRIHVFLGLLDPDPDPLVTGMDPDTDTSIIMQK